MAVEANGPGKSWRGSSLGRGTQWGRTLLGLQGKADGRREGVIGGPAVGWGACREEPD